MFILKSLKHEGLDCNLGVVGKSLMSRGAPM